MGILGEQYRFPGVRAFREHSPRCGRPERRRVLSVHPPVLARLPREPTETRVIHTVVIHTAAAALKGKPWRGKRKKNLSCVLPPVTWVVLLLHGSDSSGLHPLKSVAGLNSGIGLFYEIRRTGGKHCNTKSFILQSKKSICSYIQYHIPPFKYICYVYKRKDSTEIIYRNEMRRGLFKYDSQAMQPRASLRQE